MKWAAARALATAHCDQIGCEERRRLAAAQPPPAPNAGGGNHGEGTHQHQQRKNDTVLARCSTDECPDCLGDLPKQPEIAHVEEGKNQQRQTEAE